MDVKICRVCRETSEPMANIFDGIPDRRITIAEMISHCTGFRVSRDDSFPKTICSPCKQDATNAYEIKQLYETSHRVFCQIEKDLKEGQDLLKEEICEISDYEGTGTRQAQYEVKTEKIGKDSVEKNGIGRDEFHGQVKNEPIEEDIFEEEPLHISDHVDFQAKSEEPKDYFQADDPNHGDTGETAEHLLKDIQHPHKCSHCAKSFSRFENLRQHFRTHTKKRRRKCSYCKKSFLGSQGLKLHIRTHTALYKCSHCKKSFSQSYTLQQHIRVHTGELPYKCSHCQKTFGKKATLEVHIRTHTGERPYKCTHCEKSFTRNLVLQTHIQTHTGERRYKCSYCEKSFSTNVSLTSHILTHTHNIKPEINV